MGLDAFYSEPRALGTFGSILIILNSKLPGALSAAINIEKESRNFILHVPVSMSVHPPVNIVVVAIKLNTAARYTSIVHT